MFVGVFFPKVTVTMSNQTGLSVGPSQTITYRVMGEIRQDNPCINNLG